MHAGLRFGTRIRLNAVLVRATVVRLFSSGKDILKPKRAGLIDEHVEMLDFLKG